MLSGRSRPWSAVQPAALQRVGRDAIAAILATLLTGMTASLHAEEYLLGPQDHVRLKVYEWRASRDMIFEWTALNDEFTVGADGSLFLPFVGEVKAAGIRLADVAAMIGQQLVLQMGLGQQPDVALEVVQFRPFYITGDIMKPGDYPYRPGLTVLQALTIAGGLRTSDGDLRVGREVIAGEGEVALLARGNVSLLARKARLEAELNDADAISFPAALTDRQLDGLVATILDQERAIFAARKQGMSTQLRALQELRSFLEQEVKSLETQLSFREQQINLVQKELSGVSTLVDQGLAAAPRQMALERALLDNQSGKLDAETALLRARQEMSRTDISILEIGNQRANEVSQSLRETETQLDDIVSKTRTAVQLLQESAAAPGLIAARAKAEPQYLIVRPGANGPGQISATETTALRPGDTLKVDIPLPSAADIQSALPLAAAVALAAASTAPETGERAARTQ